IAMDGDGPGRLATAKIVDQITTEAPSLAVSIIHLPDNLDPDSYLQNVPEEHRLKIWQELSQETSFSWQMSRLSGDINPIDIADKMLPMILSEKHAIKQEIMLKELAEKTNITFDTLNKQLELMAQTEEMKFSERKAAIVNSMVRELKRSPVTAKETIAHHLNMLEEFESSSANDNMHSSETLREFQECIAQWKANKTDITGIKVGWEEFDKAIDGIQPGHTMGIGGKANQGKSSLMLAIAHNIINNNQDALVIIHSIDDPQKDVYSRLIAMNQGLVINDVKKPVSSFRLPSPISVDGKIVEYDMDKVEKWKAGKTNIEQWIERERLVVKDNTHGSSFGYTEGLVKFYRKKYPNRNIICLFDNFHKASDYGELGDERLKYKALSNRAKLLGEKQNVAMICSLEYTKADTMAGRKPTN
ncbi:MAG: DnaB-like helicase C-terminal domain-containing protein, partial [Nitrosotalea sp.]